MKIYVCDQCHQGSPTFNIGLSAYLWKSYLCKEMSSIVTQQLHLTHCKFELVIHKIRVLFPWFLSVLNVF
jgi:hypothetical protein